MDKIEMMKFGDAAVMSALANMCAILNGRGELLSRLDGDRMMFSPRLECDGECSTMLFGDEGEAQHVIDEILSPQDCGEGEFHVFKFTPVECEPSSCCCGDEDGCDCIDCTIDDGCCCDGKSELECAIEKFRDEGDETTASWLEELKMRKDAETQEQLPKED